jgi:putative addiction module component (TIGR02574 family)
MFSRGQAYNVETMSTEELEIEVLKLAPRDRARLAEKLLQSLDNLSDEENARLWAEEAERRDQAWDADLTMGRPSDDVFREARARLK